MAHARSAQSPSAGSSPSRAVHTHSHRQNGPLPAHNNNEQKQRPPAGDRTDDDDDVDEKHGRGRGTGTCCAGIISSAEDKTETLGPWELGRPYTDTRLVLEVAIMGRGPCSTEPATTPRGRQRNHGSGWFRFRPGPRPRPGRFALPSKLLLLAVVSSSPVWSKREQATCALRVSSRSTATATKRAAWQGIRARVLAVPESTAGGLAAVVITGGDGGNRDGNHGRVDWPQSACRGSQSPDAALPLPTASAIACPRSKHLVLLLKAHVTSQPSPALRTSCYLHVHRARERQQVAVGCIMHTCLTSRSH